MKVLILGSHPNNGQSMGRFTRLLADGYTSCGHDVHLARPTSALSSRLKGPLRKFLIYVEQLIIFPFMVGRRVSRADAVHIADHSDAIWLLLLPVRAPVIVTCHDLIAVRAARGELAEHRTRLSGRLYQALVRRGLRRSRVIESVSRTTMADVARLIPGPVLSVVHVPLDPSLHEVGAGVDGRAPFYLVVSSSGWRKRRELAFRAWSFLDAASAVPTVLKVVGPAPTTTELDLAGMAPALVDRIESIADIDDHDLALLYATTRGLLQLSKYEGFGWPVIEANHQGTIALCSDEPIFREIAVDNILLRVPLELNDWSKVMRDMSDPHRTDLLKANASRFSMDAFIEGLRSGLATARGLTQ